MMITKETADTGGFDYHSGQTILIDKPLKWTSFKVVALIRKTVGVKKVGHSGTLDPLATGLLILCTGKKTKDLNNYIGLEKTYTGTFILGKQSKTIDLESEVQDVEIPQNLNEQKILEIRESFIGDIYQIPPMFSAKKVNGKRLYKYARKGKSVEIEPRKVKVFEFEINSINLPEIQFRIRCSKGTYIRSIADDFGKNLGTSAILGSLRRTKIEDFSVENALLIEDFIKRFNTTNSMNEVNS